MKTRHVCGWLCITAAFLLSCSTPEGKVKDFVLEFVKTIAAGDKASILKIYPDAEKADSLFTNIVADSVTVTPTSEDGVYSVALGNGNDLTVKETGEGQYTVTKSHGLFAYPTDLMAFAKKTGQWKDGLTDAEQAERMADKGLVDYLYEKFNNNLKGGLSIINTGTWGDDYYEGEWVSSKGATFTVKNSTSIDIPGSAYNIVYKEGYWGGGEMASETVPGKDIKAGETVTLRTKKLGSSMESETTQRLNITGISKENFLKDFQPAGNEFEEYLKRDGKPVARAESMEFVIQGLMGGCGTRLTMYGDQGYLMYSLNSPRLDEGEHANRDVKRISYDPATGKLVLRISNQGTVTGDLIGTYKDGVYQGIFKNVNGKSSSFSFK